MIEIRCHAAGVERVTIKGGTGPGLALSLAAMPIIAQHLIRLHADLHDGARAALREKGTPHDH